MREVRDSIFGSVKSGTVLSIARHSATFFRSGVPDGHDHSFHAWRNENLILI